MAVRGSSSRQGEMAYRAEASRTTGMPGLDPGMHPASRDHCCAVDCRVKPGNDALRHCTPSATNRSSPSPLETSSSTDFLPSFFS
ncbi:MAG: hypothetical protein V7632_4507 [Bradyrhizobium sp.]|jgi:hypothetical protein